MQPISILKEIYNFKDPQSLSQLLDFFVDGETPELRIQKYIQFRKEKEGISCPKCESTHYFKNGKSNKKVQKYKCKKCGKGFCDFTGTFFYNIKKKEQLIDFYSLSDQGHSLDSCKILLSLSKQTVFDWRHKGNSALQEMNTQTISGITELMTFEFSVSRKGERASIDKLIIQEEQSVNKHSYKRVPKIVCPEGTKEVVQVSFCGNHEYDYSFNVIQLGDLSTKELINALWMKLKKVKMLCIPENPILKLVAISKRVRYRISNTNKRKIDREKQFHTQTVEKLVTGFKTWLARFRGIATKYLQNYLNWYLVEIQYKGFKMYSDLYPIFAFYNRKGEENYKTCRMFTG